MPVVAGLADLPEYQALTLNQQRFVEHYLLHGIGSHAYVAAGFRAANAATAEACASRMLRVPKVAAVIAWARAKRAEKIGISRQRILDELAALAFSRMPRVANWKPGDMRLVPSDELDDVDAAAVKKVKQTEKILKTTTRSLGKGKGSVTEMLMSREQEIETHDKTRSLHKLAEIMGVTAEELTTAADGTVDGASAEPHEIEPAKAYALEDLEGLP